jgi:hypothetical protein
MHNINPVKRFKGLLNAVSFMDKYLSFNVQFLQHKYLFILSTEYIFLMILANIAINSP